jgi:hypothetical protein
VIEGTWLLDVNETLGWMQQSLPVLSKSQAQHLQVTQSIHSEIL